MSFSGSTRSRIGVSRVVVERPAEQDITVLVVVRSVVMRLCVLPRRAGGRGTHRLRPFGGKIGPLSRVEGDRLRGYLMVQFNSRPWWTSGNTRLRHPFTIGQDYFTRGCPRDAMA